MDVIPPEMTPIAGQGYEPADMWLAELNEALGRSTMLSRANFNSYHEMRWGFATGLARGLGTRGVSSI